MGGRPTNHPATTPLGHTFRVYDTRDQPNVIYPESSLSLNYV